ncbi:MAG: TetR/AcrR family transcriptional regulator [Notoacmeibacter sp.]|nr:TetR/AcrR family transcriptional regulator [Notoacmeibacter sp.]
MAPRGSVTKEIIIAEAQRIVARDGTEGLTFQALADALHVSKQAILYWYPDKWALVQGFVLTALKMEAEVTIAAIKGSRSAPQAIERFLRALIAHHLADLGRFRVLYLGPQFERRRAIPDNMMDMLEPIHAATSVMYGALETVIAADVGFLGSENPRRLAVAVHMAGIGALTMLSLAEALGDPLEHETQALITSLVALLTIRAEGG